MTSKALCHTFNYHEVIALHCRDCLAFACTLDAFYGHLSVCMLATSCTSFHSIHILNEQLCAKLSGMQAWTFCAQTRLVP